MISESTVLDGLLGVRRESNEVSTHAKKRQPHLQPCATSLFFWSAHSQQTHPNDLQPPVPQCSVFCRRPSLIDALPQQPKLHGWALRPERGCCQQVWPE